MFQVSFENGNRVLVRNAATIPALCLFLTLSLAARSSATPPKSQSRPLHGVFRLSSIEVVLPPKLISGTPATLATLGADHRLVGHIRVQLGNGTSVETDATGRANFTTPAGGVLIAKAGSGSAATLIDSPSAVDASEGLRVTSFAALHNSLNLCGGGFNGNGEANQVEIDGERALVIAASPECLVVIPAANAAPGVAKISIESGKNVERATVTLVGLNFEPPDPPLTPGEKGWLAVRASGSDQQLRIMVQNESSDVLEFTKGDVQELTTSGGEPNSTRIRVQAVRSGDFLLHARILPPPDTEAARRFLVAAEPLAIGDVANMLKKMEAELLRHPNDADKIRAELDGALEVTSPSDFRTLLEAARSAL
jgi:hypothetical protein